MKIFFIGCVESSEAFLNALIDAGVEVAGVITRRQSSVNSDFVDLAPICEANGIPCIYADDVDEAGTLEFIEQSKADIGYCFGWSRLISEEIIGAFPLGMVGYHPAALPNNRGRHPIIWALVLGLDKTASTFFVLTPEPDAGDILSQIEVEIHYEDTARTLMDKLLEVGKSQVIDMTQAISSGEVVRVRQNANEGNNWRKRSKSDGCIDWRMPSTSIYNLVRALTEPYPGAHFDFEGSEIKVWRVKELSIESETTRNIEPGKVVSVDNGKYVVKTGDGLIELAECEPVDLKVGSYLT